MKFLVHLFLTFLAKFLQKTKLNYSYRIVFAPENIGAITYISKNLNKLKQNVIAGYVLTCVGDNKNYGFVASRFCDSISDRAALNILKFNFKKFLFRDFTLSGSDERRYCYPGIDLPISSITRTTYGEYKEYHTSKDDLNFISPLGFQGAFEVYLKTLKVIENNLKFKSTTLCEPQLSKRELYPEISKWRNNNQFISNVGNIINFLSYADGKNDLIYISNKLKVSGDKLIPMIKKLIKNKLIRIK